MVEGQESKECGGVWQQLGYWEMQTVTDGREGPGTMEA
jgi:hypothetical protein